jgi:hypothetical protein
LEKRFRGTRKEKGDAWAIVSADIDLIRGGMSHPDFLSRAMAVRAKWIHEGLADKTTWTDKQGRDYNFVESFFSQWIRAVPEWYMGAAGRIMAPTTNNGAESCIRNTRNDAGNVVGSVGATLDFLLQQVQHVSDNSFDPKATRKIENSLWQRAHLFSGLFGTDKIRVVNHDARVFYCCQPRQDPDDDNVCNRAAITQGRAASMAKAFLKQLKGEETAMEQLLGFTGPEGVRVFGFHQDLPFCSCPAFCDPVRSCFHTQGLAIHLGKAVLPDTLDPTLLSSVSRRGNKRKAPGFGAVPLLGDAKDLRIAELEAQVRKLKKCKGDTNPIVPASECVPLSKQPGGLKRRKGNTAPLKPCSKSLLHSRLPTRPKSCKGQTGPPVLLPPSVPLLPTSWKPRRRITGKGGRSQLPEADEELIVMPVVSDEADEELTAMPALSDTPVWQVLQNVFQMPPDILTALYTGLSQFYTEQGALQLFQEEWLRDLTDRWIPFAAVVHAKRPTEDEVPALPAVLPEFQALLFVLVRCAYANSQVPWNLQRTDEEYVACLVQQGYTHVQASGDDNNCLIHSIVICLSRLGLLQMPQNRREACQNVRQILIQTPGLHPLTSSGQKCKTAFLEHGVHAEAIFRHLLPALPAHGLELFVHARYDELESAPPDRLLIGGTADAENRQAVHLYNFIGLGMSGFHYDALI